MSELPNLQIVKNNKSFFDKKGSVLILALVSLLMSSCATHSKSTQTNDPVVEKPVVVIDKQKLIFLLKQIKRPFGKDPYLIGQSGKHV